MVAIGNSFGLIGVVDPENKENNFWGKTDKKEESAMLPDILSGNKEKLSPLEKKFDINKDGKLDKAEKKALEAYLKEKFDIDGNGELDDFEKLAQEAYKEAKMFDFNKNGKLDPEEKAAYDAYKKAQAQKKDDNHKPHPWDILQIGVGVGVDVQIDNKQVNNKKIEEDSEKINLAA